MSQLQGIEVRRPSRRTIATGAAWAVPVIAVGAAAPHASASPNIIIITPVPGDSCKFPGQSVFGREFGYKMFFEITSSVDTVFCVVGVSVPNSPDARIYEVSGDTSDPYCIPLLAGEKTVVTVVTGSSNSANGTGTFTYSLSSGATGTFTATFASFNPCKK